MSHGTCDRIFRNTLIHYTASSLRLSRWSCRWRCLEVQGKKAEPKCSTQESQISCRRFLNKTHSKLKKIQELHLKTEPENDSNNTGQERMTEKKNKGSTTEIHEKHWEKDLEQRNNRPEPRHHTQKDLTLTGEWEERGIYNKATRWGWTQGGSRGVFWRNLTWV